MLGTIIFIIHLLVVVSVVTIPFFGTQYWLQQYTIFVPFMVLHWVMNNDKCLLTLLESQIRGTSENETFFGRIFKPIYNVKDKDIYIVTFILFCCALLRLEKSPLQVYKDTFRSLFV